MAKSALPSNHLPSFPSCGHTTPIELILRGPSPCLELELIVSQLRLRKRKKKKRNCVGVHGWQLQMQLDSGTKEWHWLLLLKDHWSSCSSFFSGVEREDEGMLPQLPSLLPSCMSKEKQLWDASAEGDLPTVLSLLRSFSTGKTQTSPGRLLCVPVAEGAFKSRKLS